MSLSSLPKSSARNAQSGQALLEYILLISIVTSFFVILMDGLGKVDLVKKIMAPLSGDFAHSYRYGHPKALGYDDGGPRKHPRATGPGENIRIFYAKSPK
jgi:hypothetical protein